MRGLKEKYGQERRGWTIGTQRLTPGKSGTKRIEHDDDDEYLM